MVSLTIQLELNRKLMMVERWLYKQKDAKLPKEDAKLQASAMFLDSMQFSLALKYLAWYWR